jgi:hypothetical protein
MSRNPPFQISCLRQKDTLNQHVTWLATSCLAGYNSPENRIEPDHLKFESNLPKIRFAPESRPLRVSVIVASKKRDRSDEAGTMNMVTKREKPCGF